MPDNESVEKGHNEVLDFDPLDPTVPNEEVWSKYEGMRRKCPVAHSDLHGGFDVASRYEDVRKVAADQKNFSTAERVTLSKGELVWPKVPALEFDEPEHSWWRALMWEKVSPTAVEAAKPMIRDLTNSFIDQFADKGEAELYSAFAEKLPVYVIGKVVGLDSDASGKMRLLAMNAFAANGTPEFPDRYREFREFTKREIDARRENPRDDYLSELISGEVNGTQVTEEDIEKLMVAFLIGGHHSTASGLASLIYDTLAVPGLRDRLIENPELIGPAVEESLRLSTPLQLFARHTKSETSVGGIEFPEGHTVLLNYASANRDESVFDNPNSYDIERRKNRHLAFGYGIHACVGSHLARAELQIGLTELLRRLPDIEISGEVHRSGLIGGMLMTIVALPVRFTPEQQRRS